MPGVFRLAAVLLLNAAVAGAANTTVVRHEDMSLAEALRVVTARFTLPAEVLSALRAPARRALRANTALVQGQRDYDDEFLERARGILNHLYETEQSELDNLNIDWEQYARGVRSQLEKNQKEQAKLGTETAMARAEQLRAETVINQADKEAPDIQDAYASHKDQCAASLASFRSQLALIESDHEVGLRLRNMTRCSEEEVRAIADGTFLLQADTVPPLVLVECGASVHFGGKVAQLAQFRSPAAQRALRRAASLVQLVPLRGAAQRAALLQMQQPTGPEEELKCSVSGNANCPVLADAMATLVGEIQDGLVHMQKQIAAQEATCAHMGHEFETQLADLEGERDEAGVKLAKAIGTQNENEGESRLKNKERGELEAELTGKEEEVERKRSGIAQTQCGIHVVRQELYVMAGQHPFIQDCAVGEWAVRECSASCGGGTRQLERRVVAKPTLGASCPPLVLEEACNDQPCPVDCDMGDWSGWSACSKDCGGGIQSRMRPIHQDPSNGGEPCGESEETAPCNTGACDADCQLGFWGEWSSCSKACGAGVRVRRRGALEPARGMGSCAPEDSELRMERQPCNDFACPEGLRCASSVDVLLVLDGSGSVRPEGFEAEKALARSLAAQLGKGAQAGVVAFADTAEVAASLGAPDALPAALDGLRWHGAATNLAAALMTSLDVLLSGSREEALNVVVVLTDGTPNSQVDVDVAAAKVREQARLIFLPSAASADLDALRRWASAPAGQNVLPLNVSTPPQLVADVCPTVACVGNVTDANRTACENLA